MLGADGQGAAQDIARKHDIPCYCNPCLNPQEYIPCGGLPDFMVQLKPTSSTGILPWFRPRPFPLCGALSAGFVGKVCLVGFPATLAIGKGSK